MKKLLHLALLLLLAGFLSCDNYEPTSMDLSKEKLIPVPVIVTATGTSFRITDKTSIIVNQNHLELKAEAEFLAALLRPATGYEIEVLERKTKIKKAFFLSLVEDEALGKEGYKINIDELNVIMEANSPEGIFRGIQTIRQLLPVDIEKDSVQSGTWEIASGEIIDYPQYEYRSAMLDVSRHFFEVHEVKQFIDWLACYKMNTFHMHLSDDQGWRIEIKKWPKLTEIGGSTEVGGGEGGFYTQEQFREIVQYASDRYITIVPEIDMPGHTNAALASYAFLNCDDKTRELYTGTDVGFSTFCTQKDTIYTFIEDVISEIIAMNPGPYFHIGGDESHVTRKKDYQFFVKKVQEIISKKGKQMLGWNEIASIVLKPGSVAQVWNSKKGALKAVSQGNKVILSLAERCYIDMKYDSLTTLGLKWAGYVDVDQAYDWNPEELIAGIEKEFILGIECPLWTETITNMDEMEYMVFPRLPGYAELGWSPKEKRTWEDYKFRLAGQADRFKEMGLNYYPSKKVPWK